MSQHLAFQQRRKVQLCICDGQRGALRATSPFRSSKAAKLQNKNENMVVATKRAIHVYKDILVRH